MSLTFDNTKSPIVVTGTTDASETITEWKTRIKGIKWYAPSTAGHLVHMTDLDGNPIWQERCDSDNVGKTDLFETTFMGICIDDLDSGTVYIYLV